MSKSRQPGESVAIRSFGVTYPYGRNVLPHMTIPPRALDWHKLIYATRGVLTVRVLASQTEDRSRLAKATNRGHAQKSSRETLSGAWVVPPHRAVWIPAGPDFRVEMHGTVALRALYLRPGRRFFSPATRTSAQARSQPLGALKSCAVVNVTPLLRELILRTVQTGALDLKIPQQARVAAVIFDELRVLVAQPLQLPAPRDPRAEKFARLMEADRLSDKPRSMQQALRQSGASRRTMERIFRDETGMTLGQWLRRQKLLDALRRLAAGDSVNSIAYDLGYNSPSAFIAMFRRELGQTPMRYFEP